VLDRVAGERAVAHVVEQPAGRSDDEGRAPRQGDPLSQDRGSPRHDLDGRSGQLGEEPAQLLAHLRGELARRHDHERARMGRRVAVRAAGGFRGAVEKMGGERDPDRDGLARAGLGGDAQVAPGGLGVDDCALDGRQLGEATGGKGLGDRCGKVGKQVGVGHNRVARHARLASTGEVEDAVGAAGRFQSGIRDEEGISGAEGGLGWVAA
jgi:hypothetical protein